MKKRPVGEGFRVTICLMWFLSMLDIESADNVQNRTGFIGSFIERMG